MIIYIILQYNNFILNYLIDSFKAHTKPFHLATISTFSAITRPSMCPEKQTVTFLLSRFSFANTPLPYKCQSERLLL